MGEVRAQAINLRFISTSLVIKVIIKLEESVYTEEKMFED